MQTRIATKLAVLAAVCTAIVSGVGSTSLAATPVYDRNAAVAYANQYWNKVVSDGYFWINGSTYSHYGAGAAVPVNVSGEASGIGDDCAHFVSSCVGTPAGGLSIASRVPPTYGEPGAARLDQLVISDGYAKQVTSVSQLTPGDIIGYDWDGSGAGSMGGIDHTVIYLGNNQIAAHATSHDGVVWNWGNSSSTITFFVHMTVRDSIVPTTPANSSPANGALMPSLTPKLIASTFSDGALGSSEMAAEWLIYKGSGLIYDTNTDTVDLSSITIPSGKLSSGNSYSWEVRYEDNYGDWSSYSPSTTFSTAAVPEPTSIAVLSIALFVSMRRK